jgi:cytochrome d ubiquinol oxidase subunit I
MILAALIVSGFGVASVYAWALLKGRRDRYHRAGFLLPFAFAAAFMPVQIGVGDWAARFLADNQPVKLAALEALNETQRGAPLTIGGVVVDGEVRYGIEIPKALSLLAQHDPDAEVMGLDEVPEDERPPVAIVRTAFQVMVGIGTLLLLLGIWLGVVWLRRREMPKARSFLWLGVAAGPLAAIALEAGWITTEVGRQPWIVWQVMKVEEAVTTAPGIRYGYFILILVYTALSVATIYTMRRVARGNRPSDEELESGPGGSPRRGR